MEEKISPSMDEQKLGGLVSRLEQFKAQRDQAQLAIVNATIDVGVLGKILVELKLQIKELERKGVKAPVITPKDEKDIEPNLSKDAGVKNG